MGGGGGRVGREPTLPYFRFTASGNVWELCVGSPDLLLIPSVLSEFPLFISLWVPLFFL